MNKDAMIKQQSEKRMNRALDSYSRQIFEPLWDMPTAQLKLLLQHIKIVSSTNCSYRTYNISPMIKKEIKDVLRCRKYGRCQQK